MPDLEALLLADMLGMSWPNLLAQNVQSETSTG